MWRRGVALALAVTVVLAVGLVVAEDTIELKHKFAKGSKATVVEKLELTLKMKVTGPDGSVIQEAEIAQSREEKHAKEILEAADNKATKFQIKYHFSRETNQQPGMAEPATSMTVFHGKLYEVAAGESGAVVKCLNAKLGDKDKTKLAKDLENNFYDELFPEEAVAVGESWELDREALSSSMMEDESEQVEFTGATGTLVGLEEVEGKCCAKVGYKLVMERSRGEGAMKVTLTLEGTGFFVLQEGMWLTMSLEGPVVMSGGDEEQGITMSGKGKIKITYKAEIGVADLQGGEKPCEETLDDDDDAGDEEGGSGGSDDGCGG